MFFLTRIEIIWKIILFNIIIAKNEHSNNVKEKTKKILEIFELLGVGLVAGFINGFFGAGGGLLLVPMLSFAAKADAKKAHATTLMCVLFMCIASSIIYFTKGQYDWKLILICGIGSVIGSLVGTKLLRKLKNNIIDIIFAAILVIAGVCMLVF